MKSRITELLGIKYPIFQGGMAWVADGDLAGAVSNAGGLGIIGGGNAPKEVVKANIDRVKQITDKPFGVNIMLLSPFADDIVDLVIEEGVKVVTTGAGNPGKYMERFHEAGITVIPVIPSVALAKRMEKLGADAVVAEGMEAGGHQTDRKTIPCGQRADLPQGRIRYHHCNRCRTRRRAGCPLDSGQSGKQKAAAASLDLVRNR